MGVFNCQGAGWCKIAKKTLIHDAAPGTLTGTIHTRDVDLINQVAGQDWNGEVVVYTYRRGDTNWLNRRLRANAILVFVF